MSVALAADLRDLTVGLVNGGYSQTTIALLHLNLHHVIPSALGASLVIVRADVDVPLRLDLVTRRVEPAEVLAAMRIRLVDVLPGARGWIDFFAAAVGAFDDLADGLVLALAGSEHGHERIVEIGIDEEPSLPTRALVPGLTGLTDFSRVDQALGILLNRGHSLLGARELLRRRAQQTGTDVSTVAGDIIDWL